MLHGKGGFQKILHPKSLSGGLALWAMPVSAAVIAEPFPAAAIALVFVSAQGRGSAKGQGPEDFSLVAVWFASIKKLISKAFYYIGQLKLGAAHFICPYKVSIGL